MAEKKEYAFRSKLELSYEEALEKIGDALKTEGFGILTSVDMQATLREKLGAEFRKYSILGVCNPTLAQRALNQDLEAGLVLPCTIVIYEEGGGASISIADPMAVVDLLGNPVFRPIAEEAQAKLKHVLEVMGGEIT
ncbi:DUF302 domain-containing protein [Candidatus Bipolaricaulota bacterium]|nr:DUF302 domain-containing protein [Candidatus Bipolaricaulota bacterium]